MDAQPLSGSGRPMTMVPAEPYSDGWSPAADQVNLDCVGYVPVSQALPGLCFLKHAFADPVCSHECASTPRGIKLLAAPW